VDIVWIVGLCVHSGLGIVRAFWIGDCVWTVGLCVDCGLEILDCVWIVDCRLEMPRVCLGLNS